jgi:hypothetical protein
MATYSHAEPLNPEDLSSVIVNLTPDDTPVTSMIGRTKAKATYHEFPEDDLKPPNPHNAHPEGYTFMPKPVPGRGRTGNFTQIFVKEFTVSGTQDAVNPVGTGREFNYQMLKAMKEIARDLEVAVMNNQVATGAALTEKAPVIDENGNYTVSGDRLAARTDGKRKFGKKGSEELKVNSDRANDYLANSNLQGGGTNATPSDYLSKARQMSGMKDLIQTNRIVMEGTTTTAGAISLDAIGDALQQAWSTGGNPTTLVVGPRMKRKISKLDGFTRANVSYQANADTRSIVQAVDIIETDFGRVEVVADRYLVNQTYTDPITGENWNYNLNDTAFLIDPKTWKLAWLRNMKKNELPKLADARAAAIVGEVTLECRGEQANAIIIEEAAKGSD